MAGDGLDYLYAQNMQIAEIFEDKFEEAQMKGLKMGLTEKEVEKGKFDETVVRNRVAPMGQTHTAMAA